MIQKKPCEKCGSSERVRKIRNQELRWCVKCRYNYKADWTVAELQKKYEEGRKSQISKGLLPDWDTMLARFSNDCENFLQIGTDIGLSCERIRQIYMKYFSTVIPRRPDGRTRTKVCTIKRGVARVGKGFLADPRYTQLLSRAEEVGIGIKPLAVRAQGHPHKHSTRRFHINGYCCKLQVIKTPRIITNRWYFTFSPNDLEGVNFLILQAGEKEPKFFVVPNTQNSGGLVINIPADFQYSAHATGVRQLKTDWLQFMEAWYLLKQVPQDPVV